MKKSVIKHFKDYGNFKSFWVIRDQYAYFIVLSKYGTTIIKKITNKNGEVKK